MWQLLGLFGDLVIDSFYCRNERLEWNKNWNKRTDGYMFGEYFFVFFSFLVAGTSRYDNDNGIMNEMYTDGTNWMKRKM